MTNLTPQRDLDSEFHLSACALNLHSLKDETRDKCMVSLYSHKYELLRMPYDWCHRTILNHFILSVDYLIAFRSKHTKGIWLTCTLYVLSKIYMCSYLQNRQILVALCQPYMLLNHGENFVNVGSLKLLNNSFIWCEELP